MKNYRNILGAIVVMTLFLTSCKNAGSTPDIPFNDNVEWGRVSFSYDGDCLATKSPDPARDTDISSLQMLVFNEGGTMVAYGKSSTRSMELTVPIGVAGHSVYAAVNIPEDLSSCLSPSSLMSMTSALKDNSLSSLQMIGKTENLTFNSSTPVTVKVERFASMVEIDRISTAFTSPAHRAQEFKLTGVYLINGLIGNSPWEIC